MLVFTLALTRTFIEKMVFVLTDLDLARHAPADVLIPFVARLALLWVQALAITYFWIPKLDGCITLFLLIASFAVADIVVPVVIVRAFQLGTIGAVALAGLIVPSFVINTVRAVFALALASIWVPYLGQRIARLFGTRFADALLLIPDPIVGANVVLYQALASACIVVQGLLINAEWRVFTFALASLYIPILKDGVTVLGL